MTFYAVFLCLLRRHLPAMRFVAIFALQVHLQMDLVFARVGHCRVAFYRAGCPVRAGPQVRVMAGPAFELHRGLIRDIYFDRFFNGLLGRPEMPDVNCVIARQFLPHFFIAMTEETFLPLWQQIGCAVSMAVETGQFTHRYFFMGFVCRAMRTETLVFVTGQAIPFFKRKFVSSVSMAFGAFDLLDKDMLGMIPRLADVRGLGKLLVPFPVTPEAEHPRNDDLAVPRCNRPLAEEGETVHLDHLILL